MSRIGNKVIPLPSSVTVTVLENNLVNLGQFLNTPLPITEREIILKIRVSIEEIWSWMNFKIYSMKEARPKKRVQTI